MLCEGQQHGHNLSFFRPISATQYDNDDLESSF
jgi:hypothetical protein